MALFSKLKSLFGKKEKQETKGKVLSDEELKSYQKFIEHRQRIEDMSRDKYAIEAMNIHQKTGEVVLRQYTYASPCTRDGKQGFAFLSFKHTYTAEIYRDGGEREFTSPTYGRFVVLTEDGYQVERLDEKETMEVKQQIDNSLEQTPELWFF